MEDQQYTMNKEIIQAAMDAWNQLSGILDKENKAVFKDFDEFKIFYKTLITELLIEENSE